jgi:DNA invertase Pin-like site-specific DNA recombinase
MKYIAYLRVSTTEQDLGIDAQMNIINSFIKPTDEVVSYYIEKESGSNCNRTELNKAIVATKENEAILLIAKLDRLSRNVSFISKLMDSQVRFKACDLPNADSFTIHIFAALAQRELEMIRERTKQAMAVIKDNIATNGYHISKRGNKITSLGNKTGTFQKEHWLMGQQAIKDRVAKNENLKKAKAFASSLKENGLNCVQITALLNENGFKTSRGKEYHHTSTLRLFK